ncbi:MAG: hypothetical protein QNL62_02025 [Gammaproteobacteria bacterium]|nr:hypothetical protein [Gammaproteobacteria bacterium]
MKSVLMLFMLVCLVSTAFSGQVEVVDANVKSQGNDQYRFDVTLQHKDTGWEHYADRWEILDTDGNVLATRVLHHPHTNEQPFTRSLTATLPDTVEKVVIRGHDKIHNYGEKEKAVSLPR